MKTSHQDLFSSNLTLLPKQDMYIFQNPREKICLAANAKKHKKLKIFSNSAPETGIN